MKTMEGWRGQSPLLGGKAQAPLVSQAIKYFELLNGLFLCRKSQGHFQQHLKIYNLIEKYTGEIRTKQITKLGSNEFW